MGLLDIETGELVGVGKVVDLCLHLWIEERCSLLCSILRRRSGALIKRTLPIPLAIEKRWYIRARYHQIFFSSFGPSPRLTSRLVSLANSGGTGIGMGLPRSRAADGTRSPFQSASSPLPSGRLDVGQTFALRPQLHSPYAKGDLVTLV